jgi:hypothetical protein
VKKKCSKCSRYKLLRMFKKDIRYRGNRFCWCGLCEQKYSQSPEVKKRQRVRWATKMTDIAFRLKERIRSRKKYNPKKQKNTNYKRKYGISLSAFNRAKKCALCFETRKLVPDHSHITGKYRGPLCYRCNLAISQAESKKGWLKRVKEYLRRHDGALIY